MHILLLHSSIPHVTPFCLSYTSVQERALPSTFLGMAIVPPRSCSLSSILYYSHIIILCIKKIYCLDITPYYHYSIYGPSENPILSFILMAHLTDGTGQISLECTIAIQTCARILSYFLFFAPSFQN